MAEVGQADSSLLHALFLYRPSEAGWGLLDK